MTTDHHPKIHALSELARARDTYDKARTDLFAAVRAALAAGAGPVAVGRASRFTREYITKIRDGNGPKR